MRRKERGQNVKVEKMDNKKMKRSLRNISKRVKVITFSRFQKKRLFPNNQDVMINKYPDTDALVDDALAMSAQNDGIPVIIRFGESSFPICAYKDNRPITREEKVQAKKDVLLTWIKYTENQDLIPILA